MGRLLLTLLIAKWELLPRPLLHLSRYLEANRDAYYAHLLAVSERGCWVAWITFFLRGVIEQAGAVIGQLSAFEELRLDYQARARRASASATLPQLVDYLFERPVLDTTAVAARFDVSAPTARGHLNRLVDAGVLQPMDPPPGSRSNWYLAVDILRIAGE